VGIFKQAAVATELNVRSIPQRPGSSCAIAFGVAGVVGILLCVLGIANGVSRTILANGKPNRAIVLRAGAESEVSSAIPIDQARQVLDLPQIARNNEGEAIGTVDMVISVNLVKKADGFRAGLTVRGTQPQVRELRPEIRLTEGRWYESGVREVAVGSDARAEFLGLEVGDRIDLRGGQWTVVGVYESDNSLETGLLTDLDTLLAAYGRTRTSSVTVQLSSADALSEFRAAARRVPDGGIDALRESDYYEAQSRQISGILFLVTYFVGGLMALGALFAALNSTYSSLSKRQVEIATLRAMGYGATAMIVSVLAEILLLSVAGAGIAAGVVWALFGSRLISMGDAVGSVVFAMDLTPRSIALCASWACATSLVGGCFPAVLASRTPVAVALRKG
jgi:putative ABC transport system permease protein